MTNRYAPFASAQQAVLTVEIDGGCDSEEELFAYVRALVDTGLVNSTGSTQRFVDDVLAEYGDEILELANA